MDVVHDSHTRVLGIEQKHPFFKGLDWNAVYNRLIKPAYQPKVKVPHILQLVALFPLSQPHSYRVVLQGKEDISNFDHVFTREAPVDSRTSMDAPGSGGGSGGGGLLGFLWGRNKKGSKKAGAGAGAGSKKGVAGNDGFRGFSYVAPDALAKAVRSVRRACGVWFTVALHCTRSVAAGSLCCAGGRGSSWS